jgi:phytoene synthase
VADRVHGRLAWELRATWLGGMRVLDRLEAAGFDGARPALGPADAAVIGWQILTWTRHAAPAPGAR